MSQDYSELAAFGWSSHFQSQVGTEEAAGVMPARVVAVHRNRLDVAHPRLEGSVPPFAVDGDDEESHATIGDWLLLDRDTLEPRRLLARKSLFKRRAAGPVQRIQLIAANVDTLLVVSSCNAEFNLARLERYLALARTSGAVPVVALTKADLTEDARPYIEQALHVMPGLVVECLDARDPAGAAALRAWCGPGQTLALVGSSGVGKSTLVNTLLRDAVQPIAGIREQDAHGRHTTTGRSLHRLASGGWLLDTPGMRELQLADGEAGVEKVFADIAALAQGCRFADCGHASEPGCAVQEALANGSLDPTRLHRYQKLVAEDVRNSEGVRERHARARGFGRLARRAMQEKRDRWR